MEDDNKQETKQDIVRVLRLIEYEGPRDMVEDAIKRSINGTKLCGIDWSHDSHFRRLRITATTLGMFPEIIEAARMTPCPNELARMKTELDRALEPARKRRAESKQDDK